MLQGNRYLVKWSGYHKNQSKPEPSSYLFQELSSSYMYLTPTVCSVRLGSAVHSFEMALRICISKAQIIFYEIAKKNNFKARFISANLSRFITS